MKSIVHTVSATEARVHFGELLQRVVQAREPVTIERAGKPQAVLLALEDYQRLVENQHTAPVWQEKLNKARQQIQTKLAARRLPDPAKIIRDGRDQRDRDIINISDGVC